jgi:hypothetical protein
VDKKKKLKLFSLLQEPQKPSTAMNATIQLSNLSFCDDKKAVAKAMDPTIQLNRLLILESQIAANDAALLANMAMMKELEESNAELMESMTTAQRYKIKMEKRRTDHEDEMRRKRGEMSIEQMRYAMGWSESEWQVYDEEHDMPHVVYYHVETDEQRFTLPDGHILCEDGLIWDTKYMAKRGQN